MESRIHLEKATREGSILFTLEGNLESKFVKVLYSYLNSSIFFSSFEFMMCNPPFYSSPEEVAKSASEKDLAPYAVSIVLSDSTYSDKIHLGMYRS
jgi:23S rRNA A1618 N6-methylase RlmF